jgi:hypothetical protein
MEEKNAVDWAATARTMMEKSSMLGRSATRDVGDAQQTYALTAIAFALLAIEERLGDIARGHIRV